MASDDTQKPRDSHPWVYSGAPQLLVSLRDVSELPAALAGGADLIDIKDPGSGSLGRAQPHVIREVAEARARSTSKGIGERATFPLRALRAPDSSDVPSDRFFSVALGELLEWQAEQSIALPANVRWVKLGLAGCADRPGWFSEWQHIRRNITSHNPQIGWIAVAYADVHAAQSPDPQRILEAAIETRCTGLLIDTFSKRGQRLGDWLGPESLGELITSARTHGLLTAVAGSLKIDDLEWLCPLQPDIVAIRSAACCEGVRTSTVDAELVANFRAALRAQISDSVSPVAR